MLRYAQWGVREYFSCSHQPKSTCLVSAIHGAYGNARLIEKANPGMSFGVDLYKNLVIMLNFLPHSANRTEYEEVACMVLNIFDLGLRETMDMCLSGVFFGEISCNPSFQLNSRITRENGWFLLTLNFGGVDWSWQTLKRCASRSQWI